jgi:hypothetical protein
VGALVVALVFTVAHRGKGSAVPATTTSSSSTSSTSTTTAESPLRTRPPQIGAASPTEASVGYRLVLTPSTVKLHEFVTATVDGELSGLAPSPLLLTVDDQIGGFWRTLVWFVGAPPGVGPFTSGVVIADGVSIPRADVPVPVGAVVDPFEVQVEGLVPGDYRLCRRFVRLGGQPDDYVCTTLTVTP